MIRTWCLGLWIILQTPGTLWAGPSSREPVKDLGAAPRPQLTFLVLAVSGTVLTRTERSGSWDDVRRGETLHEGQLLQIMENSSLSLRPRTLQKDAVSSLERADLTLSMPLILRLGPQMLRKVALTRYFLQELPQASLERRDADPTPRAEIGEAWRKIAAVFTRVRGDKAGAVESLSQLESRGFTLSLSAKQLRILTPSPQAVILMHGLPSVIKAAWSEAQGTDQTYKIFFWPTSKSRPAPVALTRATHYQVRVTNPGTFFLQIASDDETWQSRPHVVQVSIDHGIAHATTSSPFTSGLELTYPPDLSVVQTAGAMAPVSFAWTENRGVETDHMHLVVTAADGREIVRQETREPHVEDLVLPVGDYEWYVETNQIGQKSIRLSSAVHSLKVQKSMDPLASGVVDEVFKSGGSKTVFFTNGF